MTRDQGQATRWITTGQVAFGAFLAVCVAIRPGIALKRSEVGLSNYGIHAVTVVPYTMAFIAAIGGATLARHVLSTGGRLPPVRRLLDIYALCMSGVLLSTYVYSLSSVLRDLHVLIGSVTFVVMFTATAWIWLTMSRSWSITVGAALVSVGFVISGVTIIGVWHLLFVGQVVTVSGFSVVLAWATRRVEFGPDARPSVRP